MSTESEEFPLLLFSDAYFHIPISLASWKFLRFVWNNKVYQFLAVPFGLEVAPQVFSVSETFPRNKEA
jgi:hypothetical protein